MLKNFNELLDLWMIWNEDVYVFLLIWLKRIWTWFVNHQSNMLMCLISKFCVVY